jgi:hypothetical protein
MIPDIQNNTLRRVVLVLTVLAIIVVIGPIFLIGMALDRTLYWVENEFEVNLAAAWRGKSKRSAQ